MEKMRYLLIFSLLFGTIRSAPLLPALHIVSLNGDREGIRTRLKYEDDVNSLDSQGRTPLHYAAESGHLGAVRLLLDKGARVDIIDNYGHIPLVNAVRRRHKKVTRLLLAQVIGMDQKGVIGEITFIGHAVLLDLVKFFNNGSMDVMNEQLLEKGDLRWLNEVSKRIDIHKLGSEPSWEELYLEKICKDQLSLASFDLSDKSKEYLDQRKKLMRRGLLKLFYLQRMRAFYIVP